MKKRNWSDFHPKILATALAGALLVGVQAAIDALTTQQIPGIVGTIITLGGGLLAGYLKTGD